MTKPIPPETPRAALAFRDFVDMGAGRSLRALVEKYRQQTDPEPPTRRLKTLSDWSSKYQWQARISSAVTAAVTRKLERAAEMDADTFLKSSERLNDLISSPGHMHPADVTRIRESVRKPEPKAAAATIDVTHSGTIKHAHHDMSAFTDEEIDTLAEIASRQKAEVAT